MIVYLSLLVCIAGLLLFAYSTNAKTVEVGKIMFFCGLLAFLLLFRGQPFLRQPLELIR